MKIEVCDICGEVLEHDGHDNEFKRFPNGQFGLDFSQAVLNGKGEPLGWSIDILQMCPSCHAMINQAIFDKIEKIQETIHRPTVMIPLRKFPPEPIRRDGDLLTPTCGCGRADD